MRTVTVELTEAEYAKLRATWAMDVDKAYLTAERYLGLVLAMGGRIRAGALEFGQGSSLHNMGQLGEPTGTPGRRMP